MTSRLQEKMMTRAELREIRDKHQDDEMIQKLIDEYGLLAATVSGAEAHAKTLAANATPSEAAMSAKAILSTIHSRGGGLGVNPAWEPIAEGGIWDGTF